jgi:RNA methyltransferase, TrmH family
MIVSRPLSMPAEPEVIRSRSNPLFKRLVQLKERGDDDLALVEGVRLLNDALDAGVKVREGAVSPRVLETPRGRELLQTLAAKGAAVRIVDDRLLSAISEVETSQGLVALAERPTFTSAQLFRATPLILVAVGIQNPGNLGGLLRTAEAAGATGAILTEGTADPCSWKALRGSMGSAFRLPHLRGLSIRSALALLHAQGVSTVAAYATASVRYDEANLQGPSAFLFGNEGSGLPSEIMQAADQRVGIPMQGGVESLNVSVAAGILLFEAARQRRLAR